MIILIVYLNMIFNIELRVRKGTVASLKKYGASQMCDFTELEKNNKPSNGRT